VTPFGHAFLTREGSATLHVLDLGTGLVTPGADLSVFADADGNPDLGRLELAGAELYVQIRRLNVAGRHGYLGNGALAIVDAKSGAIIDADPATPRLQAIELQGPVPSHRMQAWGSDNNDALRGLLVSCPGHLNDDAGSIDLVDLALRRSVARVVSERGPNSYANLGGFAVNRSGRGVFVFHTDLLSSAHLQLFQATAGAALPPGVYDSLGAESDVFALDSVNDTLFFADRGVGTSPPGAQPGVHAFDATTGRRLTAQTLPVPGTAGDLLVVRTRWLD
jgi:hypothetical protein